MIAKDVKKAFDKKANSDGRNNEPAEIDAEEYITSMVQAAISKLTMTTNDATAKPKVTQVHPKTIKEQSTMMAIGNGPRNLYCVYRGEGGGIDARQVDEVGPWRDNSGCGRHG